jgi:hypothetical protein
MAERRTDPISSASLVVWQTEGGLRMLVGPLVLAAIVAAQK